MTNATPNRAARLILIGATLACTGAPSVAQVAAPSATTGATPSADQDAAPARETRTVRIPGTVVKFDLVRVPADADAPALWVARTEVTWDLYDIYLYALDVPEGEEGADAITRPSKPYVPPDRGMGHADFPAMGMTRHAAETFCAWLKEKTGLDTRLPTPAEFERYAGARAEHHSSDAAPDDAWTSANSDHNTHEVATLAPNALGLCDTLGNVAEWVATDGKPIAMGGSYLDPPDECHPDSTQKQASNWNMSDPQIPKSQWWLADCSWVGFRFVVEDPTDDHHPDE